jgi:hypothetical protein
MNAASYLDIGSLRPMRNMDAPFRRQIQRHYGLQPIADECPFAVKLARVGGSEYP